MAGEQEAWRSIAMEYQDQLCDKFEHVDWDKYEQDQRNVLKDKVRIILYGLSNGELNDQAEKLVVNLCNVIVEQGTHELIEKDKTTEKATYMVFIFVIGSVDGENVNCWPVFKVPKNATGVTAAFIDINCRVYDSWTDFLQNNKLPACWYCYPTNGVYYRLDTEKVAISFAQSPEATLPKKVLTALDVTSSGVALGSTVLALASLAIPIAGPVMAASAVAMGSVSAYTVARSSSTLHDRRTHKQSISFQDAEARNCYISIAGSTLGLGATAATSATVRMAQSGQVMGKFAASAVTTLNAGALFVNGVGIANGFHHILQKHKEGQLNALDVAQFSASLLLFYHATSNFQTTQSIIENTQNKVIGDFKDSLRSNKHRNAFKKTMRNTTKKYGNTEGKALVIRSVKQINNVDDFFAALVRTDKDIRYTKNRVHFADGGFIQIDNGLPIDPSQLSQLKRDQRVTFLRATQKFSMNKMSDAKFKRITQALLDETTPALPASSAVRDALNFNTTPNQPDQASDHMNIFSSIKVILTVAQISELKKLLGKFPDAFGTMVLELTNCLFQELKLTLNSEYMNVIHFISLFTENLIKQALEYPRKYLLSLLRSKITITSSEEMTRGTYCLAILEQFLLNPAELVDMYNLVRSFFYVLIYKSNILKQDLQPDFFELIPTISILLNTNTAQWHTIIDFAIKCFDTLGFKTFSSLVAIVRDLCLYIEQAIIDMEVRYNTLSMNDGNDTTTGEDNQFTNYCSEALKSLDDDDIHQALLNRFQEHNIENTSNHNYYENTTNFQYTKKQPLVVKKDFLDKQNKCLFTDEEMLDLCKQILKTDISRSDCIVDYEGLTIAIAVGDNVVIIECDLEEGSALAYAECAATNSNIYNNNDL